MQKMTAIADTRKRSREEDSCDFMPISKRINNLTLTSQRLREQDFTNCHNVNDNNIASNPHQCMENNQEIQSQHFAQSSILNSYQNGMSHQYQNHNGQSDVVTAHNPNYHHQSHIVQSTNHSNGFQNNSHLVLGNNIHKQNHHHHHQQQMHNDESNNSVYRPELTADENPFYYDKNKLLFDLHVERQRRHQSHQ